MLASKEQEQGQAPALPLLVLGNGVLLLSLLEDIMSL